MQRKSKNMEWNRYEVLSLISEVEVLPWIWDPNDIDYRNVAKKNESYVKLSERYNCNAKEIERKWKVIRGQYLLTCKRQRIAKDAGNIVKLPKWFAFPALDFLMNIVPIKDRQGTHSESANLDVTQPVADYDDDSTSAASSDVSETDMQTKHKILNSNKRQIVEDSRIQIENHTIPIQPLVHSGTMNRDEFDVYSENIAVKLRKIKNEKLRIQVQRDVDNLIYDALSFTGNYADFKKKKESSKMNFAEFNFSKKIKKNK